MFLLSFIFIALIIKSNLRIIFHIWSCYSEFQCWVSMLSSNQTSNQSLPVQSSGRPSSSETFEQTARIFLYLQTFSSFSITFKDHLSRLLKFFWSAFSIPLKLIYIACNAQQKIDMPPKTHQHSLAASRVTRSQTHKPEKRWIMS